MTLVYREVTETLLIEEAADAAAYAETDAAAAEALATGREMARIFRELPDGFRVERVQGRPAPSRDPGAEYSVIDLRLTPQRMVGTVARRLIGDQRISWTAAQLLDFEVAQAMAVALRLAACDAEARTFGGRADHSVTVRDANPS